MTISPDEYSKLPAEQRKNYRMIGGEQRYTADGGTDVSAPIIGYVYDRGYQEREQRGAAVGQSISGLFILIFFIGIGIVMFIIISFIMRLGTVGGN
jgi:hypothetical protein